MTVARIAALSVAVTLSSAVSLEAQSSPSFVDVSAQVEVAVSNQEPLLAFGDYDADGDPDLLVDGRRLFRNESSAAGIRFVDVTDAAGLKAARGPSGCWFDFDLDGHLDIGTATGEIWIGDGKGSFRNLSKALAITVPHGKTSAAAWGDIDGDGWLDLVTGGDNTYNPLTHYPQSCWRNSVRKRSLARVRKKDLEKLQPMRDVTKRVGLGKESYGRSIVFCDYDCDGDQDFYSGNYHLKPNGLYQNIDGVYTDVAAQAGVAGVYDQSMFTIEATGQKLGYRYGHTIGATWADLNNDGYFDLWVSNLAHKLVGKRSNGKFEIRGYICGDSQLFVNQGPPSFAFEDRREAMGIACRPIGDRTKFRGDELWSNAVCGDLDNNGWVDTYVNQIYRDLSYSYGFLFCNDGGQYREVHADAGIKIWGGYGSAFADLDSDGRLDVVVCGASKVKGKPTINFFRNTSTLRPWLGLDLVAAKRSQTVGVQVLLIQERGVQVRQVATTMGSHGQQNDGRVHFGVGDAGEIVDVLVIWPDGAVESQGALGVGDYHQIKRRNKSAKQLKATAPSEVVAGTVATFTAKAPGKPWTYYWDFGGSRQPEVRTSANSVAYTFADPGLVAVTVTAVHPRLAGREFRMQVRVKAP